MQAALLSELVLRLTDSAMNSAVAVHQSRMVDFLRGITPFDMAWWGWSNFSAGRINLVCSETYGLPRSFETDVRAVLQSDPFIRYGRNLPVYSMTLVPARVSLSPEFRSFAAAYGLRFLLNGHCRLREESRYNFFMSLYRRDGPEFTQQEAADFRIILLHLEQSLSLSLRSELQGRAPAGGEAALLDSRAEIVRASRGFHRALEEEGLEARRLTGILRRLGLQRGSWTGHSVTLTAEPYADDLSLVRLSKPGPWDRLARQERKVAELYLSGLTMPEIAASFRVSPHTVRNQISAIYRKTGSSGKLDLSRRLGAPP
jgi:DNA-binding CsgD family transcriptional regulator